MENGSDKVHKFDQGDELPRRKSGEMCDGDRTRKNLFRTPVMRKGSGRYVERCTSYF